MWSLIPRFISWWSVEKLTWWWSTAWTNNERDHCIFQGGLISVHTVWKRPEVFRGVILIAPALLLDVSSFRVSNLYAFKRNCSPHRHHWLYLSLSYWTYFPKHKTIFAFFYRFSIFRWQSIILKFFIVDKDPIVSCMANIMDADDMVLAWFSVFFTPHPLVPLYNPYCM